MKCSRCYSETEVVSEYYDFEDEVLTRDRYCSTCNSVLIEKFYKNNRYVSDWIDINVRNREE
jgi:ribosomal protein S27AE